MGQSPFVQFVPVVSRVRPNHVVVWKGWLSHGKWPLGFLLLLLLLGVFFVVQK